MSDHDKLRERLLEERRQIADRVEHLKARTMEEGESHEGSPFGKREEEASEAAELEKRLALESKLRTNLSEIDHALEKFESGTYGQCESCGQAIEEDRLGALPQARLCLTCKARQAKDAKGTR